MEYWNSDGLVKSLERPLFVIPAQAGIQYFHLVRILWIPVFTGMTTFYDSINSGFSKRIVLHYSIIPPFHYSSCFTLFHHSTIPIKDSCLPVMPSFL